MLRCAFCEKDITPQSEVAVKDALYVRVFVCDNGKNKIAVLSVDGCMIDESLGERISENTGIARENILIGYTNARTGIPAQELRAEGLSSCVIEAINRLSESTLYYAKTLADGISFCSNYYMKNSSPVSNPPRMNDEISLPFDRPDKEVNILFVCDATDKPSGAIVSFACRPDCVGDTAYSGDYVSELTARLKKTYGEDFTVVYLLAPSADVNHIDISLPEDEAEHYRKIGGVLADAVEAALLNRIAVEGEDVSSKLEYVKIPHDAPLQVMQIGDFKLFAFSSDVYCHFGKVVKLLSCEKKYVVASMSNAYHGVISTRELPFSSPGIHREAGYLMAEKLVEMSKR